MSVNVPADRPQIDPHPLSPYVAWAGNRNRDPILIVFKDIFPKSGNVLELASGAGNHINYFAPHFPSLSFQPSDYNVEVFDSIKKKRAEAGGKNIFDPVKIDLTAPETWPSASDRLYDVIFAVLWRKRHKRFDGAAPIFGAWPRFEPSPRCAESATKSLPSSSSMSAS